MIEILHYFTRMLQKLHIGALVEKRVRRQRLGRASEFFIKASGGRQRAHGTAALIKVPKRENVTKAQARVSSVRKLQ